MKTCGGETRLMVGLVALPLREFDRIDKIILPILSKPAV
jgi:hypothetical protein